VGRLIGGRYLVGARIARGSVATVYRARDHRLGRDVALKIVRPEFGRDPGFREGFAHEARTAAHLTHPHVVQVFDQDCDDDLCYLAMELLEGGTLRDYLSESGALAPREALDVLEPVLDALAAAHGAGLVHADVKPENVIITEEGRIKVTDLGLARATASCHRAPELSARNAAYLAPEILSGGPADARSDVHAVGIMLFEMLTGSLPYAGESYREVAQRHREQDVPRPSGLVPALTELLDGFVLRAAARNPADRPTDAAALAQTLRTVRAHLPDAVLDLRAEKPRARVDSGSRPGRHRAAIADQSPAAGAVPSTGAAPPPAGTEPPPTAPVPAPFPPRPEPSPTPGQVTPDRITQDRAGQGQDADPAATRLVDRRPPDHPAAGQSTQMMPGVAPYGVPEHQYPPGPGAAAVPYPDRAGSPYPPPDPGWYPPHPGPEQDPGVPLPVGRAATLQRMIDERGRRGVVGVGLLVALSVLLAGWAWWVAAGPGAYRPAPDVVGMTQRQAVERLAAEELGSRTENDYSDTAPTGTVLRTDPPAGGKVRERGRVTLFVCVGPRTVTVPSVQGRSVDEVTVLLEKAHLTVGDRTEQYHDSVPLGSVVSSDPVAGREVDNGTTVALVLSRGPRPVTVPNVVGSAEDRAVQALARNGLNGTVSERRQDRASPRGQVISQTPSAGGTAGRGSTVALVVSDGPPRTQVPDVTNQKVKDARKALEQAGFTVVVDRVMGAPMGLVRSQNPGGGRQAQPGSAVTLHVF